MKLDLRNSVLGCLRPPWSTLILWAVFASVARSSLHKLATCSSGTLGRLAFSLFLATVGILLMLLAQVLGCCIVKTCCRGRRIEPPFPQRSEIRPVAILLCTRDDWIARAAYSCIEAMRDGDHLYICDDSESPEFRNRIDMFARNFPSRATVLRRASRSGWKAGNLNNALSHLPSRFPYFMVVDHDNVIRREHIMAGLNRLRADPQLAFVQFSNVEIGEPPGGFARDLGPSVRAVWWFLSSREAHGFRFTLGHSVIFRSRCVEEVSGFPEWTLTEDLGITLELLKCGHRGEYCTVVPAEESVPDEYVRFRSRHVRWCIGTLQSWVYTLCHFGTARAPLRETLDGIIQSLSLFYGFPLLIIALLLVSGAVRFLAVDRVSAYALITAVSLASPSIPLMCSNWGRGRGIRSISIFTSVYLSMIIPSVIGTLSALCSRHKEFQNSGNSVESFKWSTGSPFRNPFSANGLGTMVVEIAIVLLLLSQVGRTGLNGLGMTAGLACGPVFSLLSWDSPVVKSVKHLPALLIGAHIVWLVST